MSVENPELQRTLRPSFGGGLSEMTYQGGKSRIANDLSQIITGGTTFVSLFCGGCAVEEKITGFDRMILNDQHPYLIALWKGLQSGYVLPESMTREEYAYIREHKDEDPVLTGFAGFGCSFGGKWFGGFARNTKKDCYCVQSRNSLARAMKTLEKAEFLCRDYRLVPIPPTSTIYADPPYKGTTGYNKREFRSDFFWSYMRILARNGHKVFISEMEAPEDFSCIWQKEFTRTLNKNQPMVVTEKLFTYGG